MQENGTKKSRGIKADEHQLAYQLTRYFKSIGSTSKLAKNDDTSRVMSQVAARYLLSKRPEESLLYAQAAMSTASRNNCLLGLARAVAFEAEACTSSNILAGPNCSVIRSYEEALRTVNWHVGEDHPISMALHDRLASLYIKAGDYSRALCVQRLGLQVAELSLGKNHSITADYFTKVT
jgi:hypothetical protein